MQQAENSYKPSREESDYIGNHFKLEWSKHPNLKRVIVGLKKTIQLYVVYEKLILSIKAPKFDSKGLDWHVHTSVSKIGNQQRIL